MSQRTDRSRMGRALSWASEPFREILNSFDVVLGAGSVSLGLVFVGLLSSWWLYVPVHELLHVAGCWITGGSIETLEISPLYGGALLARIFPFVEAGGDYAGRLSAFEANGDLGYLATDLAPFVLCLLPGFWLLRRATRLAERRPRLSAWLWGSSLPPALSPLLSLTGDAYEIGSILATRVPPMTGLRDAVVGDDLLIVARNVEGADQVLTCLLAAAVGLIWALSMLQISRRLALALGEPSASASS